MAQTWIEITQLEQFLLVPQIQMKIFRNEKCYLTK